MNEKSKRSRISFSFNADASSNVGLCYKYLLQNEELSAREGKAMANDAIVSYWKPFAYKLAGSHDAQQLREIASASIYRLERHIDYLREVFGLLPSTQSEHLYSNAMAVPTTERNLSVRENSSYKASEIYVESELLPASTQPQYDSSELGFGDEAFAFNFDEFANN